jgi:signal peptidase II
MKRMEEKSSRFQWALFISITVLFFLVDALSKNWAVAHLSNRLPLRIFGQYVQLLLVYNKGALFGFDPRHFLPWLPLNAFFFAFSVLAVPAIVFYFSKLCRTDVFMRWGLTLILPGALGNLYDRIVHPQKGVVDFIRIGISEMVSWPIFNGADLYVTLGIALVFISFYREERQRACTRNV